MSTLTFHGRHLCVVSVRMSGSGIAPPLPNHKGNFDRKTLLCPGRTDPLPSRHLCDQLTATAPWQEACMSATTLSLMGCAECLTGRNWRNTFKGLHAGIKVYKHTPLHSLCLHLVSNCVYCSHRSHCLSSLLSVQNKVTAFDYTPESCLHVGVMFAVFVSFIQCLHVWENDHTVIIVIVGHHHLVMTIQ